MHRPFSIGSSLPARYRALGLGHLPCQGTEETVEHLVFQCPAHDQARRDTWPGDSFTTDPRRLWSYLERIAMVTRSAPPPDRKRETESRVPNKSYFPDTGQHD